VARVLIVGGGCRGRLLAAEMIGRGHAARVTTRTEAGRAAIEATGAECVIGTPDRLGTLRGALESVTIVCWLLASAEGSPEEMLALHGSRLASFLGQAVDTTMRGFLYEVSVTMKPKARGVPREALVEGERIVRRIGETNAIPVGFVRSDPEDAYTWLVEARAAVDGLLGGA
jgi:hypothetical protein